jgi:hypothetical protein
LPSHHADLYGKCPRMWVGSICRKKAPGILWLGAVGKTLPFCEDSEARSFAKPEIAGRIWQWNSPLSLSQKKTKEIWQSARTKYHLVH